MDNLQPFFPLTLADLSAVNLLDREDTKYVFHARQLSALLAPLRDRYGILEIDSERRFRYENLYYDTRAFDLYLQHHNGKRPRYKIRFRTYTPAGTCFFEIKIRNNRGRTEKKRLEITNARNLWEHDHTGPRTLFTPAVKSLIRTVTGLDPEQLIPSLGVFFSRMTLVAPEGAERLTIDSRIRTLAGNASRNYPNVVIAELKQSRYNPKSEVIRRMRELSIAPTRASKYCMGINAHFSIKSNRFKPRLRRLEQVLTANIN